MNDNLHNFNQVLGTTETCHTHIEALNESIFKRHKTFECLGCDTAFSKDSTKQRISDFVHQYLILESNACF